MQIIFFSFFVLGNELLEKQKKLHFLLENNTRMDFYPHQNNEREKWE